MISLRSLLVVILALPGAVLGQVPSAASAPSDGDAIEHVEITTLRDPIDFSYASAYEVAIKVRNASAGAAELAAKVIDRAPHAVPLSVSLQYEDIVVRLAMAPDGSFTIPIDPDALARQASLNANRPRAEMLVQLYIRPHLDRLDGLTRADVARLVDAGRAARGALFPWYLRVQLPTIRGIRLCSLRPDARFSLRDAAGAETPLPVLAEDDVYARPARCVDMAPTTDRRQRVMALVLPPDATVGYSQAKFERVRIFPKGAAAP